MAEAEIPNPKFQNSNKSQAPIVANDPLTLPLSPAERGEGEGRSR